MQYVPFDPSVEVRGQSVYAIVDGFGPFIMLASQYLLAQNIGSPEAGVVVRVDPEKWYSQASLLKAFEQISRHMGDHILFQIGETIPRNAVFPPWVVDIHTAIKSLDVAYHMNHRIRGEVLYSEETGQMLEGIGHYGYEPVPNKKLVISVCHNPNPCVFDRGILNSLARRWEATANVLHDDSKPCRKHGGESCTYLITWR